MPKLIDADKLKEHYAWWGNEDKRIFDTIIDLQSEAVVRCKDCIHYYADPWGWGNCVFEGGVSRRTNESDFCSWGERKEDETN